MVRICRCELCEYLVRRNIQREPGYLDVIYRTNILKWKTTSEINTSHFKIERSVDGENWEHLNDVAASGNSNTSISYVYLDKTFGNEMNYYRLAQYDNDGTLVWVDRITIDNTPKKADLVKTVNAVGQVVAYDTPGIVFDVFSNGSTKKRINE